MFNIDVAIVIIYLIITIIIGYRYGRSTITIADYALGSKNFSTASLVSTVVATWVSGSYFVTAISNSYRDGILYFLANTGNIISLLLVGYFLAPKMRAFLGDLSIADSMGKIYGSTVQKITSIFGILISIGVMAMQLKILSSLLSYFGLVSGNASLFITTGIVIFYCMFGGIRSVVFTDILQITCMIISILPIFLSVWESIDFINNSEAINAISSKIICFDSISGVDYASLFLLSIIPVFTPATFNRILIAKNTKQIRTVFSLSAFALLIFLVISCSIGIMLFSYNPGLEYDNIFPYMLENFAVSKGVRGIVLIAVISMAMSTIDSHLNSASVIFSNDLFSEVKIFQSNKRKLLLSRAFAFLVGSAAIFVSLKFHDLVDMLFFVVRFYSPVITIPLLLAILGFRSSSSYPALIGMSAGFLTALLWNPLLYDLTQINALIPSLISNIFCFFSTHYYMRYEGKWISFKTGEISVNRNCNFLNILCSLKKLLFNAAILKRLNLLQYNSYMYSILGLLIIFSYFSLETFSISTMQNINGQLILQFTSLIIGSLFLSYPLWNELVEEYKYQLCVFALGYFIYSSFLISFMQGFSTLSVLSLLMNIIVSSFFSSNYLTVILTIFGSLLSFLTFYILGNNIIITNQDFGFLLSYGIPMLSIMIISFVNRYQDQIETLENSETNLKKLNEVLNSKVEARERNLKKALDMHSDILRNINHEIKTPMSTLMSNADLLKDTWKDPKLHAYMDNLIDGVSQSVVRFSGYASNLIDLSAYQTDKMLFDIRANNLRNLLVEEFKKKSDNIFLNYPKDVVSELEFDEIKIKQVISNILDNANKYSEGSDIEILVSNASDISFDGRDWKAIKIIVKDAGIGIPRDELEKIFEPFALSSRTFDGSGGRGLGLAISREIINAHHGSISASNNIDKGVSVEVILPVKHPIERFLSNVGDSNNSNRDLAIEKIDLKQIIEDTKKIEEKHKGKTPKILMIDDDRSILNVGSMIIKGLGYEFIGIETGEEAALYINGDKFDASLIFLDMMLGDTDGLAVMKRVKSRLDESKVPVIIQSGLSAEDKSVLDTLELGAKEFMAKPYRRADIDAVIKKYLG